MVTMANKITDSEPYLDQMRSCREFQWYLGKAIICLKNIDFVLFISSFRAQFEGTLKVKTKGNRKAKQSFTEEEGWKCCQLVQEATL